MPTIRRATLDDLATLVRLRLALFRAMGELADTGMEGALAEALARYFAAEVPAGRFLGWLAHDETGAAIGCGGLVFAQKPPSASNLGGREAYLMNMYTDPARRGRGGATGLLATILDHGRTAGVGQVRLHEGAPGRPIYERAGFTATGTEMVLTMK
jgi:GNAT superfamily N-acetyltransferase